MLTISADHHVTPMSAAPLFKPCVRCHALSFTHDHGDLMLQESKDCVIYVDLEGIAPCCARLLRGPLGLDALLAALRRVFWQGAGDWAAALVGALCRAAAGARPLGAPQLRTLLEEALRVRGAPFYLVSASCSSQLVWQAGL